MENSQDYVACCVLDTPDIQQATKIINVQYNEDIKQINFTGALEWAFEIEKPPLITEIQVLIKTVTDVYVRVVK